MKLATVAKGIATAVALALSTAGASGNAEAAQILTLTGFTGDYDNQAKVVFTVEFDGSALDGDPATNRFTVNDPFGPMSLSYSTVLAGPLGTIESDGPIFLSTFQVIEGTGQVGGSVQTNFIGTGIFSGDLFDELLIGSAQTVGAPPVFSPLDNSQTLFDILQILEDDALYSYQQGLSWSLRGVTTGDEVGYFSFISLTEIEDPTEMTEPGMAALFGLGLAGIGFMRRRRKSA